MKIRNGAVFVALVSGLSMAGAGPGEQNSHGTKQRGEDPRPVARGQAREDLLRGRIDREWAQEGRSDGYLWSDCGNRGGSRLEFAPPCGEDWHRKAGRPWQAPKGRNHHQE